MVDGVVNGVGRATTMAGDWLRGLQTGRVPSYALAVAGGLAIIAFWAIFFAGDHPRSGTDCESCDVDDRICLHCAILGPLAARSVGADSLIAHAWSAQACMPGRGVCSR